MKVSCTSNRGSTKGVDHRTDVAPKCVCYTRQTDTRVVEQTNNGVFALGPTRFSLPTDLRAERSPDKGLWFDSSRLAALRLPPKPCGEINELGCPVKVTEAQHTPTTPRPDSRPLIGLLSSRQHLLSASTGTSSFQPEFLSSRKHLTHGASCSFCTAEAAAVASVA